MEFGESLRKERELRGISLEDISAQTKVNIRFLEAIEHDDLSALPAKAFAKGFLRSYARAVGLDEALVLTNFEYCHHAIESDNPIEQKAKHLTGNQSGRGVFIVLLLIILLLTAMIILYYRGVFQLSWL
jgi:cytoskeleton protein RodZ